MKKILAIILSLILALSMGSTTFAQVSNVENTGKVYTFGSLPGGFWVTYAAGASTSEIAQDGSENVLKVTTSESAIDYNMFFVNNSTSYAVTNPVALSYDVKISSVDEAFDLSNPVINPHFMYENLSGSKSAYIDQANLPSAYYNREDDTVTFKAASATDEENGFTNYSSYTGDADKWYTVKYYIDPTGGILKTYVIDRETGDRTLISQKTGLDIAGLMRFNFTSRGKAVYLFDNLKISASAVDKSSFKINSFNTRSGLDITAELSDSVEEAQLKADGTVIETIENSGDGVYKIINTALKNTVKTYNIELLCYDSSGNVIETVSRKIAPSAIISKTLLSENATEKTISANTDTLIYQKRGQAVVETEYEIKFSEGLSSFNQEPRFFNQDGSAQSYGGSNTYQKIISGGAFSFSGKAYTPNIWYKIRTVFDSFDFTVTVYVDDGNGEKMAYTGTTSDRDYKYGYYLNKICISGGTAAIRNGFVKEIFTQDAINATSYVNYIGETTSIDGKIPTSAKGVNVSLDKYTLSSIDGVKLYKDGEVVSGAEFSAAGNNLFVSAPSFEEGKYTVSVSGITYKEIETNLIYEADFETEEKFAILAPNDNASLGAGKVNIAVSTLGCDKLEIYANDIKVDTKESPASIYTYEYTPENYGTLKIDAVATLSDGTKETDTVYVNISGTVLTHSESRIMNYIGSAFSAETENVTDFYGSASTYFKANTAGTSNAGYIAMTTSSATADTTRGIVSLKYNIKIDDVSAFALRSETRSITASGASMYDPYPLNSKYMFEYGNITKAPKTLNEKYTYEDGKWYGVELKFDMRGKKQWAYITDLESGVKTTLADGVNTVKSSYGTNENGELIGDGYGIYQLKYELAQTGAEVGKGFIISPVKVENYENVPMMTSVKYGESVSENGMIEECDSVEISLSSTLFDADTANYITLTKNGESVNAEISYADGKITVTPEGGFKKNNRYKVTISGDAKVSGKVITIPVTKEITVAEDGLYISPIEISKGDTEGSYKAEINYYNYGESTEDGVLVLTSYTGDRMTKISLSTKNKFTKGYGILNAEITGVASGETVKAMLWNNTSALSPIIKSGEIIANE